MASLSIITVLDSGVHLHFSDNQAPASVEAASEWLIADHISTRLRTVDGVKRFVIVFDDLSWKVDCGIGQHLQYAPAVTGSFPQLIAERGRR